SNIVANYALIGANDPANFFLTQAGGSTNLLGTIASPLNANLGPLTRSGGVAPSTGTLVLRPNTGSPAINAGNPAFAGTDQPGLARVAGPPEPRARAAQARGP